MNRPDDTTPAEAGATNRVQTWAGLLAVWTEFARRTGAIADTSPLRPLKAAAPDIIALQALCFALAEIMTLPARDRHVALDLAWASYQRHAASLRAAFTPMPEGLAELIDDTAAALTTARAAVVAATVIHE